MRPGVLVAALTLLGATAGGIVNVSVRAGALETRVDRLEKSYTEISGDVKHLLDATARIETQLDAIDGRLQDVESRLDEAAVRERRARRRKP